MRMENSDDELRTMRERISSALVLEREGFKLDRAESTRSSRKYRRGEGEIIIVQAHGGWWDPTRAAGSQGAAGDVIALLQRLRPGTSLGEVRKVLRPLIGQEPTYQPLDRVACDRVDYAQRWSWARPPQGDALAYLTRTRAIPPEIVSIAVRANVLRGWRDTAWFLHSDAEGRPTGAEMRGPSFRGFTKNATKCLFRLSPSPELFSRLVVTEAAIDALSYAALFGVTAGTTYVSTGGGVGPETAASLRVLMASLAEVQGAEVVAATDADSAGDRFAAALAAMAAEAGVFYRRHRPDRETDWNAILQSFAGARHV